MDENIFLQSISKHWDFGRNLQHIGAEHLPQFSSIGRPINLVKNPTHAAVTNFLATPRRTMPSVLHPIAEVQQLRATDATANVPPWHATAQPCFEACIKVAGSSCGDWLRLKENKWQESLYAPMAKRAFEAFGFSDRCVLERSATMTMLQPTTQQTGASQSVAPVTRLHCFKPDLAVCPDWFPEVPLFGSAYAPLHIAEYETQLCAREDETCAIIEAVMSLVELVLRVGFDETRKHFVSAVYIHGADVVIYAVYIDATGDFCFTPLFAAQNIMGSLHFAGSLSVAFQLADMYLRLAEYANSVQQSLWGPAPQLAQRLQTHYPHLQTTRKRPARRSPHSDSSPPARRGKPNTTSDEAEQAFLANADLFPGDADVLSKTRRSCVFTSRSLDQVYKVMPLWHAQKEYDNALAAFACEFVVQPVDYTELENSSFAVITYPYINTVDVDRENIWQYLQQRTRNGHFI
eukprot:TRINITY_DN5101_c0_g1_i4.p1 TRINITY_DN5101_c0_g1~~TRINITY_DN5101_c0_g1_i4.p1  ORF type:complete len:462 (+),score=83.69 TRINITY_DN5101_c0_g1_i4:411-1796(+)